MFVSLLKSIGKFGGFRLGIGKRITAKNAWWLLIVLVFVLTFQLTYYMILASLWLMYAMFYGIYWYCKDLEDLEVNNKQENDLAAIQKRLDSLYQKTNKTKMVVVEQRSG